MKLLLTIFLLIFASQIKSQSSSVFEANYFNMGDKTPLIEIGKGFNVTDVYKPTIHCFVNPNSAKLKRAQSGQRTSIRYFILKMMINIIP